MSQLSYTFDTPKGIPGGLYDLANYNIQTYLNGERDGVMGFGLGVVAGTEDGMVVLPTEESIATDFRGVTINGHTTEMDLSGVPSIGTTVALGCLSYGRVWARVPANETVADGDALNLIISGNDAGKFTKTAGETTMVIQGKFIGPVDNGLAPIELYNQAQVAPPVG